MQGEPDVPAAAFAAAQPGNQVRREVGVPRAQAADQYLDFKLDVAAALTPAAVGGKRIAVQKQVAE